ncbi:MAG: carboxylesterase family protein [Planctomycetota bacterium]
MRRLARTYGFTRTARICLVAWGVLILGPGSIAVAGEPSDPVRAFLEDPENQGRINEIREDMEACLRAYPSKDAASMKRLEGLQDVPFGVFETLVRDMGGGTETRKGVIEVPFTVKADGEKTTMLVFIPETYDPAKRWPLLVTMHGHAGLASHMLYGYKRYGEKHGILIAAPQAHTKYAARGWASIKPERSNPLSALEVVKRMYRIDPDRVILGGCCMGGHGTWEVGSLYADRFMACFPTIGGPRKINFAYVENRLNLPMFTYVGLKDQEPLVWCIHKAVAMLEKIGAKVRCVDYPDIGHVVVRGEDPLFFDWAKDLKRNVYPKKVIWAANHPEHRRAYWVRIDAFRGKPFDPYKATKVPFKKRPETDQEFREMYIEYIRKKTPRVVAEILDGNRIQVTCKGLRKITLFLSDRLLDLDRKVTVTVNGKACYNEIPERSIRFLLNHVAKTNDTGRVFAAAVTVNVK